MRDPDDTAAGDLFAPAPEPVRPREPGRCFICFGEVPCMEPETCPAEYQS